MEDDHPRPFSLPVDEMPLPVDLVRSQLTRALSEHQVLLVYGPTGVCGFQGKPLLGTNC